MGFLRRGRDHWTRGFGLLASVFLGLMFVDSALAEPGATAEQGAAAPIATEAVPAEETVTPAGPKFSIGSNGFRVGSADGAYEFKIGGRVQVDGSASLGNVQGADAAGYGNAPINGAELRRARIETKARVARHFIYAGEVGFSDNKVGVKDFWVGYDGLDHLTITVGNQKQPYSLEFEESSNDLSFVERGIDHFLLLPFVDRAIGARFQGAGNHWFYAVGIFGESVSPDTVSNEGWGVAGRGIFSPIVTDDTVLHLGFRIAYRQPNPGDDSLRIRDETTHMSNLSVVDTGLDVLSEDAIHNVDDITLLGPEVAFAYHFASLKGEYNFVRIRRDRGQADLEFQSGYVSLSLALCGQNWAKAYKMSEGEFKRLRNENDFNPLKGHWGGLELAGRWSIIDLDSKDIRGGTEQAFSTALNWSLNYNARLMFDWTRILKTGGAPTANDPVNSSAEGLDMVTVRAHFMF